MRKTTTFTVTDEGRDKGKVFILTEMPAAQAEEWALRALLALAKSGIDVPDDIAQSGLAGIAHFGLKGLSAINYADAKPLLDEMFDCVGLRPDPKNPQIVQQPVADGEIEEIATRLKLRAEVFKLHVSFSQPADASKSTKVTSAGPASPPTRTFLPRSAKS